jgi:hypothetical protein
MRKILTPLLIICLIFILSAPAPAQETTLEDRVKVLENLFSGLSFYGSARFATFYEKSDSNFISDSDKVTGLTSSSPLLTGPDQKETQYGLAGNSRIGFVMDRGEGVGGKVELAFKNDGSITLRKGYGTYTFDRVILLIGQDYTPLSDWDYSNQVFNGDNDLAGWGIMDVDGKRIPQIKIKWNGLQIALVENKDSTVPSGLPSTVTDATTQVLLPNLEARYRLNVDNFFGDVFGGINSYKVKSKTADIDQTITSYAYGIGCGVKFNPLYTKGMVWMAHNGKQMGMHQADQAGATFNSTDYSLIADKDFGGALVVGANIQKVTVEAGYGFVSSEKDTSTAKKDKARNYYLNATIPVAQNVLKTASFFIVPEVGVYDYMKNASGSDQGKALYAGTKWQVDF